MSDPFRLDGRVALVTGANAGIGQAIAVAMARAGAQVICAGRRDCDATLDLIGGGRQIRLDLADPMAARDVFAAERVDILVNNAGIIRRADAVDFTEADWDAVIDVNLKALFFTAQAFGREAIKRGDGKVVRRRRRASPDGQDGEGGGFGLITRPAGAYVINNGEARWVPAIDVNRVVIIAAVAMWTLRRIRANRRHSG